MHVFFFLHVNNSFDSLFTIHYSHQWALFCLYLCIIMNIKFIVFGLSLVVRGSWFLVFGTWIKCNVLFGNIWMTLSLSKPSRIFTHKYIKDVFSSNIWWKCAIQCFHFFHFSCRQMEQKTTEFSSFFFFFFSFCAKKRFFFIFLLASVWFV